MGLMGVVPGGAVKWEEHSFQPATIMGKICDDRFAANITLALEAGRVTITAVNVAAETGASTDDGQAGPAMDLRSDGAAAVVGTLQVSANDSILPSFTAGTRIMTRTGEVAVEDLRPGDEVLTRDHGFRPLVWTGRCDLTAAELIACPACRPVRIAAGALGAGLPLRDMTVSPQHRMLLEGYRSEMLFGEAEVLVAADHLTELPGVEEVLLPGVSYVYVMFDQHEIICADGTWTESFQLTPGVPDSVDSERAAGIVSLFPEMSGRGSAFAASRMALKAHEARVLLAA